MSTTKLVICTLVATVYVFLIDYVWYGMLMTPDSGDPGVMPNFLWVIIGYLIFGLMFCIIYAKGVEPGSATQQGLRYGIMIGFITAVALGFVLHGVSAMGGMEEWSDLSTVLRDSAFEVVKLGILGVIIAHLSGVHRGVDRGFDTVENRGDTIGGRQEPQPPPPEPPSGG